MPPGRVISFYNADKSLRQFGLIFRSAAGFFIFSQIIAMGSVVEWISTFAPELLHMLCGIFEENAILSPSSIWYVDWFPRLTSNTNMNSSPWCTTSS